MVRVLGNRPERVRLNDLGDTIYYRQTKEYTDQEFKESKDLQRAVQGGSVIVVDKDTAARGSIPEGHVAVPSQGGVNAQEIRKIIREETQQKESFKDVVPALVDLIRQEISGLAVQPVSREESSPEKFVDPSFAPSISTEGMKATINLQSREVKSDDLSSSLEALKKMKSNPNNQST